MPTTPAAETRQAIAWCSFCAKPDNAVDTLVAGPGVYICNECAASVQQIMQLKPDRASVPRLAAWQRVTDLDELLGHLPRVAKSADLVEQALAGWVRRARELGATWARIGEALGMTRQSAWARFSGEE